MSTESEVTGSERESSSSARQYDFLQRQALAQTATRAESLFAWFRVLFCSLILVVFAIDAFNVTTPTSRQVLIEGGVALGGIGFSVWVLRRGRRDLLGSGTRDISVIVDAALGTFGLATNWDSPIYRGSLAWLDTAVVPLITMTSVLRLSPSAVVWSAVANTSGLVLLVGMDSVLGFPVSVDKLLLLCLYQGAAILVAWFATDWFIGTLRQASLDSVRAERARTGLLALLTDHHDVGSLMSDARLNAERLHELLERAPDDLVPQRELSGHVIASMGRASELLHGTRSRALRVLDGAADPQPVDIAEAARFSS